MPMPEPRHFPLILDTHVWIWILNGDERARQSKALPWIERATRRAQVKVSILSVWEVGMLAAKGRISLAHHPLDWVRMALGGPGISLLPLTEEIAIESTRLPGEFHGDPVERILIASAKLVGGTLMTCDQKIIEYSKRHALHAASF
jgi:PIN domain nuclease of toxin-antitoxin system